jgi:hypothetical protein
VSDATDIDNASRDDLARQLSEVTELLGPQIQQARDERERTERTRAARQREEDRRAAEAEAEANRKAEAAAREAALIARRDALLDEVAQHVAELDDLVLRFVELGGEAAKTPRPEPIWFAGPWEPTPEPTDIAMRQAHRRIRVNTLAQLLVFVVDDRVPFGPPRKPTTRGDAA